MEESKRVYCSNREEWRKWLEDNGASAKEIWLIYYKKHTGKPRVSYDNAVEEAICFGWIDSTIKRIDDERYMQKFTPRNTGSNWSEHNVNRANRMIREGKMTERGFSLFEEWKSSNKPPVPNASSDTIPDTPEDLLLALKENKKASENFVQLAPSYKRLYIRWIIDAKKKDTRKRRIDKAVAMLEKNVKSFM